MIHSARNPVPVPQHRCRECAVLGDKKAKQNKKKQKRTTGGPNCRFGAFPFCFVSPGGGGRVARRLGWAWRQFGFRG